MGTILADGQCHLSFYVQSTAGSGPAVVQQVEGLQAGVRAKGGYRVPTTKALADQVSALPGVACVIPAGPRSALPLALRMASSLTGRRGMFAGHIGNGAASDAIRDGFRDWKIGLHVLQELEGDMPVSFLVVDPARSTEHESVTLYPLSRKKYRHRSRYPDSLLKECDAQLLNRANQGILESAQQAHRAGKLVNLRIHGYSRHVSFEDFRPLLPFVHHLVIDSGHHALRDTAKAVGLNPPRGWPYTGAFPPGLPSELAAALDAVAGRPLLHAYVFNRRNTIHLIGSAGQACVTRHPVIPLGKMCDLKITARSQGAMLAAALLATPEFDLDPSTRQPRSLAGLQTMADWILAASQHGLLNLPWQWPEADFNPAKLKMEVI